MPTWTQDSQLVSKLEYHMSHKDSRYTYLYLRTNAVHLAAISGFRDHLKRAIVFSFLTLLQPAKTQRSGILSCNYDFMSLQTFFPNQQPWPRIWQVFIMLIRPCCRGCYVNNVRHVGLISSLSNVITNISPISERMVKTIILYFSDKCSFSIHTHFQGCLFAYLL